MDAATPGQATAETAAAQLVAAITADLLEQGAGPNALSRWLTVTAFAALAATAIVGHFAILGAGLTVAIAAGLAEAWLAVRVGFDAALFRRLATVAPEEFDAAMLSAGLLPAAKAGRPIAARAAGARRLLALQGGMLIVQALALPVAVLVARLT
jgi:hypothetical protein